MFAGDKSMESIKTSDKGTQIGKEMLLAAWSLFLAGGGQGLSQIKEKSPHHINSPK